ncbi:MAG: single-stranded DNA-binding protein [Candidatus Dormibacteria bacterium]
MSGKTKAAPVAENPAPEAEPRTTRRSHGAALNRTELIGRLTADPTLSHTPKGVAPCKFRLATNGRREVDFHDVVAWNKLAETVAKYLAKGRLVYLSGRIHGNQWKAEDGSTRRSVEIVAEDLQILSPKPSGTADAA